MLTIEPTPTRNESEQSSRPQRPTRLAESDRARARMLLHFSGLPARGALRSYKAASGSAVSVAANIAEGNGRLTTGEYLNHLSNARGSLREADTHLEFALRLSFAPEAEIIAVRSILDAVAALLARLIMRVKERGNRH